MPPIDIAYCLIALGVIFWLGVLTIVVGACRSAARGDRALLAARDSVPPTRSERGRLRLVA
ncbi:MAG TPA: hypothetical protein VFY45_11810 [Baekduia sp.]|jgi:hypothetical protein|nr:hypothetical protein [Baekduia sp.]